MNTSPQTARLCPACRRATLAEATRLKQFRPRRKPVMVELRVSRCPACGTEHINAEQRRENLKRLQARKVEYGPLLMGEEIVALRKKYGLTQRMAAQIFGKGLIAFSRYENETSYPDLTTTKLLKQAIARPEVLKDLADESEVEIPLWNARCDDVRREKLVRLMTRNTESRLQLGKQTTGCFLRSGNRTLRASTAKKDAFELVFVPASKAVASPPGGATREDVAA